MRLFPKLLLPLLTVPLAVGGCSALGLGSKTSPGASGTSATPTPGAPWFTFAPGSATPSPQPTRPTGSRSPVLPPVTFLPADPACSVSWTVDPVLIPMRVTPGAGKLTVTWPRQYDSDYRITAVKQPLISGAQPAYTWQYVPTPPGCLATATITGLKKGVPYIVWLDAPNTGYEPDGTRHPYSGKSGVVYPL
ncbi:hypothetical protein GCM10010435_43310 [Winogradskya consettensis]|uniref:Fibronectin type-III domain-containing protein n=1 Tax=Winogradskya consettensis TaxID=113560 RepID=A0A919T2K8_9ACTN|nr:hypothetical protein [Actinoplanes consettensis]GIM83445.1 hypothetical protein Aco04nite_86550 [Actinoplanes consettensis]